MKTRYLCHPGKPREYSETANCAVTIHQTYSYGDWAQTVDMEPTQ